LSVGNKKSLFPWRNSDFKKQTFLVCCYKLGGARRIYRSTIIVSFEYRVSGKKRNKKDTEELCVIRAMRDRLLRSFSL